MARIRPAKTKPSPKTGASDLPALAGHAAQVNRRWRRHFRHLTELREHALRLRRDLASDAMEAQPAFSKHMADAGTDTYDRDLALGLLSHEQDALYEIEQALDRIRNGTYGICELTGKRISPARLAAIPWARFTTAAERTVEHQGALRRARLGSPGTARGGELAAETRPPAANQAGT